MKNQPKSKTGNGSKDTLKGVHGELATFDEDGTRVSYFCEVCKYLKNVKPSSVESERVFSASGNVATKLRSSLEDKTLKCPIFSAAPLPERASKKYIIKILNKFT